MSQTNHQLLRRTIRTDFPACALLTRLQSDPLLTPTNFTDDFPILNDPVVARANGSIGSVFGNQIQERMFWHTQQRTLLAAVWFTEECEGPPGAVHGGAIATAFDRIFGTLVWRWAGFGAVTLQLNVSYRQSVPLGAVVLVETKVVKTEGKKYWLSGSMTYTDDKTCETVLYAESTALFYQKQIPTISYEEMKQVIGKDSGVTRETYLNYLQEFKKYAEQAQQNVGRGSAPKKKDPKSKPQPSEAALPGAREDEAPAEHKGTIIARL